MDIILVILLLFSYYPFCMHTLPSYSNRIVSTPEKHKIDKVTCKPREAIIPLIVKDENEIELVPDIALVKRCAGFCSSKLACIPTKIRIVQRTVMQMSLTKGQRNKTSITFELEEHESCRCGCKVQPVNCGPLQKYQPEDCKCVCANELSRLKCLSPRVWDENSCQCVCPPDRETRCSSTGIVFNEQKCRCIKKKNKTKKIK